MYLTPGVVNNFLKAGGVKDVCRLCTKRSQGPILKVGSNPGNSGLINRSRTVWKNSYVEHKVISETTKMRSTDVPFTY